MPRPSLASRVLGTLLAFVMLTLSAGFSWAVTDDYVGRDIVPAGVRVGDVELGGMTAAEARAVIEREVAAPLLAPADVVTPDGEVELRAQDMLSVDVDGMVDSALQPRRDVSLPERVYLRLSGESVAAEVRTLLAVDEESLQGWIDRTALAVDRRPVDSTLTVGEGTLTVVPHQLGYRTLKEEAATELAGALESGRKQVELPVVSIPPTITDDSWGKSILVDISQRRLWLYDGARFEKTYRVAVGTGGYPTPRGWWRIVNKRYMPAWSNPGSAWAASMPAYIPPGSGNPLGTRALDLNASGIRIHGTSKRWSVGTAASHGCMRMLREDIEELYDLVPVGTRVIIVR